MTIADKFLALTPTQKRAVFCYLLGLASPFVLAEHSLQFSEEELREFRVMAFEELRYNFCI